MLSVLNQFKRIYADDGSNDKKFDLQESRLRKSLDNLKVATDELIRASNMLSDILIINKDKTKLH